MVEYMVGRKMCLVYGWFEMRVLRFVIRVWRSGMRWMSMKNSTVSCFLFLQYHRTATYFNGCPSQLTYPKQDIVYF